MEEHEDRIVGVTEASRFLGISTSTLLRYANSGAIPHWRTLGSVRKRGNRKFAMSVLREARSLMEQGKTQEEVREHFASKEAVSG